MRDEELAQKFNLAFEKLWVLHIKEEQDLIDFSLTNQQQALLILLIHNPHITPTMLADKMGITKSAVSQLLKKLETEGFIKKKQHVKDKRTILVELGRKGKQYKKDIELFNRKMFEKYYSKLAPKEMENIIRSFEKLVHLMEGNNKKED
ncbi:MarR family winged helix-turn-helix transcriptional regulator [Bacillus taeanensis]|uniref:MarR family transcriptional regulator n=1 Tax=Bacillus taeanensis TaxID=273032 RepID=A0A366Y0N6_9BACI|nr:MarR family transcriptional regulator [Bacillus taeanensis]RBW70925.1 MarR family transcriptional regulator [Bacillus taeanensis]